MNKSEIYLGFEPLLARGEVELLDDKTLFAELRGLERRTGRGRRDVVDHGPGQHDDLANATAGVFGELSGRDNKLFPNFDPERHMRREEQKKEPRPVPSETRAQPQAEGTAPSEELSATQREALSRLEKKMPQNFIYNKL